MVIITRKIDARKLNVPIGTIMNDEDAPAHLIDLRNDMLKPLTDDQKKRFEEEREADLAFAKLMRSRVKNGELPF